MPSALGGIMGAIRPLMSMVGPLGTALGIAGAPATGGASLLAALPSVASAGMGLAQNFMGQPSATPSIKAPALTAAPIGPAATPDIPTTAGTGSISFGGVPGAGASPASGAGTGSGDITNLIMQALGTGGGSPFAAFGG